MAVPQPGTPARKPRRRWRWHVPPALVHGNETLEGTEMLEEFSGAVGLALWQSMRDVTLWAAAREAGDRVDLFHPGAHEQRLRQLDQAGIDAAIDAPLRVLARISADATGVTEDELLAACRDVSAWAEAQGRLSTAIAFAQAGALAAPANAAAGFRVGQLTKRKPEYARAESWFRRVIGLGRQAKDWASYSEAFLGLGELYTLRGNFPAARRFHVRALRAAKRHGLRDIQGRALHAMFVIARDTRPEDALELARQAFRAYGSTHTQLPTLARDLASYWMDRGRFAQALAVFQALAPHQTTPEERMLNTAAIGRAAGGAANRPEFDRAWDEVWSFAGEWHAQPYAAQALLDLARGAASLKDWSRAERAASTAREIATRHGMAKVVLEAETVLDQVSRKRGIEAVPEPAGGEQEEADTEGLAADLLRTLTSAGRR